MVTTDENIKLRQKMEELTQRAYAALDMQKTDFQRGCNEYQQVMKDMVAVQEATSNVRSKQALAAQSKLAEAALIQELLSQKNTLLADQRVALEK